MSLNNLSKLFRFVNENGDSLQFTFDKGYLISKPIGIDTVTISHNQAQGINQVGATIQSRNIQPRVVNVTGVICGNDQDARKDRLLSIIRPDLKAKLYADDYYLDVYPTSTPTVGADKYLATFSFSLIAPYPYWQHDENASIVLLGMTNKFRLWDRNEAHRTPSGTYGCWNISGAYSFGEAQSNLFINVKNDGQLPVPFTAKIKAAGAVTNPTITNAVNNKFIKLNHTMEAGEVVTLELTHSKSYVNSSAHGDIRGALSLSSTLFRLDVGDNILKPSADLGGSSMTIAIDYATEIVGIAL